MIGLRTKKLGYCLRRPSMWAALSLGVAPTIDHLQALRSLRFKVVLDVGANRGQFALLARVLWPRARIICFEPLPGPLSTLNKIARLKKLEVMAFALSDACGRTDIYVTKADDSSSMFPISDLQKREFASEIDHTEAAIETRRLDSLSLFDDTVGPVLLKVDVQGAELKVLAGAAAIMPSISAVYVECSFQELYTGQALANEIVAALDKYGFALSGVFNQAVDMDGRGLQADFLFQRRPDALTSPEIAGAA